MFSIKSALLKVVRNKRLTGLVPFKYRESFAVRVPF